MFILGLKHFNRKEVTENLLILIFILNVKIFYLIQTENQQNPKICSLSRMYDISTKIIINYSFFKKCFKVIIPLKYISFFINYFNVFNCIFQKILKVYYPTNNDNV